MAGYPKLSTQSVGVETARPAVWPVPKLPAEGSADVEQVAGMASRGNATQGIIDKVYRLMKPPQVQPPACLMQDGQQVSADISHALDHCSFLSDLRILAFVGTNIILTFLVPDL